MPIAGLLVWDVFRVTWYRFVCFVCCVRLVFGREGLRVLSCMFHLVCVDFELLLWFV